jgi:hypothetical protein
LLTDLKLGPTFTQNDDALNHPSLKKSMDESIEEAFLTASQQSMGAIISCPVLLLFWYAVFRQFLSFDMAPFYNCILPWTLTLPSSMGGAASLQLLCRLTKLRILSLRAPLDKLIPDNVAHISENAIQEVQPGFFINVLRDYFAANKRVAHVTADSMTIVLLTLSQLFSLAYIGLLVLRISDDPVMQRFMLLLMVLCLTAGIVTMYPLASISDSCDRINTVTSWASDSLHTRVLQCSQLPMSSDTRSEYIALADVLSKERMGAKFPGLGRISGQDMVSFAKIIVTVTPVALTYTITAVKNE